MMEKSESHSTSRLSNDVLLPKKNKLPSNTLLESNKSSILPRSDINPNVISKVANDFRIAVAAMIASEALHFNKKLKPNREKYLRYRKLSDIIKNTTLVIYMLVGFFDYPAWCIQSGINDIDNKCYPNKYPQFVFFYLNEYVSVFLEFFCLFIFVCVTAYRHTYLYSSRTSLIRELLLYCLTFAIFVEIIYCVSTDFQYYNIFCEFARIIICPLLMRSLRECLIRLWWVLYHSFHIYMLLMMYLIIWSVLSYIIFGYNYEPPDVNYFPNLRESTYNMWILMTTANYPDIMMPYYAKTRWTIVFFVIYLTIGLFFLMKLILAFFCYFYKIQMDSVVLKVMETNKQFIEKGKALDDVYHGGNFMNIEDCSKIIENMDHNNIINLKGFKDYSKVAELLDTEGTGLVLEKRFNQFLNVLKIKNNKFHKKAELRKLKLKSLNKNKLRLKKILKSGEYLYFLALMEILSVGLSILSISLNIITLEHWIYLETIFTIFHIFDCAVRIYIYKIKIYCRSPFRIYEFVMTIATVIIYLVLLIPVGPSATSQTMTSLSALLAVFVFLRALLIITLSKEILHIKYILVTVKNLFKPFYTFLLVLYIFFYFFGQVGMFLYGGKVYIGAPYLDDPGIPPLYIYNSFNSLGSAFLTLFSIMLVNNWHVTTYMYVCASGGNTYHRYFFIIFQLLTVHVILNLTVAFVLDMYNSQKEIDETDQQLRLHLYHKITRIANRRRGSQEDYFNEDDIDEDSSQSDSEHELLNTQDEENIMMTSPMVLHKSFMKTATFNFRRSFNL